MSLIYFDYCFLNSFRASDPASLAVSLGYTETVIPEVETYRPLNVVPSDPIISFRFIMEIKNINIRYSHFSSPFNYPKTLAEQNRIRKDTDWLELFAQVRRR